MSIPSLISAPRVCGDDPPANRTYKYYLFVLPAYAGMIPVLIQNLPLIITCSPRMRG